MVTGKYGMGQIIEALAAFLALIALPTVLLVVPSPLHDVLAVAVSTFNLRSSPQPPYRVIAAIVVYQVLDVQFHAGTRRLPSASLMYQPFYGARPLKGWKALAVCIITLSPTDHC